MGRPRERKLGRVKVMAELMRSLLSVSVKIRDEHKALKWNASGVSVM